MVRTVSSISRMAWPVRPRPRSVWVWSPWSLFRPWPRDSLLESWLSAPRPASWWEVSLEAFLPPSFVAPRLDPVVWGVPLLGVVDVTGPPVL